MREAIVAAVGEERAACRRTEQAMFALLTVTAVLFALGAWAVVRLSGRALHRLGIDPLGAALWLGLAEHPPEDVPVPRARPSEEEPAPAARPREAVVASAAQGRPRAHVGRRRATVAARRARTTPAPAPAARRPRPVAEWGDGVDFAFATSARARR